jgi:hypothetical protein
MRAIIYVSGLDVLVEGFGGVKDGETEDAGCMLPGWYQLAYDLHVVTSTS